MIAGRGLYDAGTKKIKFETADGKHFREVQADWDKNYKALRVTVPPFLWLFGEEASRQRDEEEEEMKIGQDGQPLLPKKEKLVSEKISISLTLNNQEWITAMPFKYHDCSLTRLAFVHNFAEAILDEEEKHAKWVEEEPEEIIPAEITQDELKKRNEEKAKKAAEETEEVTTVAKRKGYKMYLYGENFIKSRALKLMITYDSGVKTEMLTPIFKNSRMLAFSIPDMGGQVPVGNHLLNLEITLNGQTFTSSGLQFLYNSVDPALSEEDLRRLEEEESKNAKKAPPKKK